MKHVSLANRFSRLQTAAYFFMLFAVHEAYDRFQNTRLKGICLSLFYEIIVYKSWHRTSALARRQREMEEESDEWGEREHGYRLEFEAQFQVERDVGYVYS